MSNIFISYRRSDSKAHALRLHDDLVERFGPERVFVDLHGLTLGERYVEEIAQKIRRADVVLVLIGPAWLNVARERHGRTIDDADDFVKLEILTAVEHSIRVIPVLLDGATMPRAGDLPAPLASLASFQAFPIETSRWKTDVDRLVTHLEEWPARAVKATAPGVASAIAGTAGGWVANRAAAYVVAGAFAPALTHVILLGTGIASFGLAAYKLTKVMTRKI